MTDRKGKGQSKHKEVRKRHGEVRKHYLFGNVAWFNGRTLGRDGSR